MNSNTAKTTPWLVLFSRPLLFLGMQALFALLMFMLGSSNAWDSSAAWWPITVALADAAALFLMVRVFKAEKKRYWDIFRIDRKHIWRDLLYLLGITILSAPVSYLPNIWLGQALFGSPEATLELFIRPLPFWAVYIMMVIFPILQGLSELPTYFAYVMPRFESQGLKKWLALSLPALMLGLQHIAAPLLFDLDFILWRGLMFIPFAFLVGLAFRWRPQLLPYFVVVHIIMNMSFTAMFLSTAY